MLDLCFQLCVAQPCKTLSLYLPGASLEWFFQEFPPHYVVHYNTAVFRYVQNKINLSYSVMKDGTMRMKDAGVSHVILIEVCPVPSGKACQELDW